MEYVIVNSPICKDRTKKELPRWQKLAIQKKRERLEEEFSVEQLIEMGFYSHTKKQRPFGVEVIQISSEEMDADWRELREVSKCRIRLFPPDGSSQSKIQNLEPRWNSGYEGYYWQYQIYGAAIIWVVLDLLSRLIILPCWDYSESIPLYWNFGNEKARGMLEKFLPSINKITFDLNIPPPKLIEDSELEYLTRRSMQLRIRDSHSKVITPKAKISFLRHHYTPYDYLWQTSKMDIEDARKMCNELIKNRYPHLFENDESKQITRPIPSL